jgi:hypothetical protein
MLSVAEILKVTVAPEGPVAFRVIGAGTEVKAGAELSTTLTSNPAGPEVFPASSFAVHETWVVPSGYVALPGP